MKYFIFLMLAVALAAAPVLSQTGKGRSRKAQNARRGTKPVKAPVNSTSADAAPPVPTVEKAIPEAYDELPPPAPVRATPKITSKSSDVLIDAAVGEGGVSSLLIPEDLTDISGGTRKYANGKVSWTAFTRSWRQPPGESLSALEVFLTVTSWDNPISEVIPELRPDLATPEHLILLDLLGDLNRKNEPNSIIKEAKALEIAGWNGAFSRAELSPESTRVIIAWGTYRYYKGKLQGITFSVTSGKNELEKAIKILQSLKIE